VIAFAGDPQSFHTSFWTPGSVLAVHFRQAWLAAHLPLQTRLTCSFGVAETKPPASSHTLPHVHFAPRALCPKKRREAIMGSIHWVAVKITSR
jgi:hypothetical protein